MTHTVKSLGPFGVVIEARAGEDVNSLNIEMLRELFFREHFIVLRGFSTFQNSEGFAEYCERWGQISLWPFGKVLELIERESPEDHIFDNNYVPMHWDGMYRPQIPEYQIFHCVQAPLEGQGGRTTFSNTALVLKNAPEYLRALWSKVTGVYQRQMEYYNSKTVSPIIVRHPQRDLQVIRYNEPPRSESGNFLNPPNLEFLGLEEGEQEAFHRGLQAALYAPENFYAHEWLKGDVVISDNYTLLHGREGFVSRASRHLQRVHVLGTPAFDNPGLESYK